MADPEIKLVFNAETGKASKNIQDLYNRILDLEKNRGSDFTDKEIRKINDLIETYAKYEHKVVKFNEYIRQINATEFSNETIRDKTLENTERKFQIILGYGTQIATAMRDIGINPRVLESFVNLANTLSVANKELDVAFANRERLLKQPTAPRGALVTSYRWENGDSPDNPDTPENQFKKRYAAVAADIEAYQKTLNVTIESTERLKAAFREKYAALKETDEGYIQQKQLLESLMVTTDRQLLSLGKLREGVQGQIEDFEKLYKTTSDSKHWLTGLQGIEERISGVAETQQKVDIAAQNSINIQNKYNNAQLKNNEKAIKSEEKYQAVLEVTGMTYEELTQLYSQLLAARTRAQTPEQIQAIDRPLTAVRKSIALLGREAQLSGAKMIGSQTSVLGVMQQVVSQWRNGTLTLQGLTQGIKLFAKSTLVLAGIQFAWEGISWALEKAKEAFLGTAEAEERAAERAEALAEAAQKAGDELKNAQIAFAAWKADQDRAEAAKQFADALKRQNEYYVEQVRLVDEATAALLRQAAVNAKEDEHELALERLKLQEQKMKGEIDEYEFREKLVDLESSAAKKRRNANVESKALVKQGKAEKLAKAKDALTESEMTPIEELGLSPAKLKAMIAAYQKDEAKIQQYEEQYNERESLKTDLANQKATYKNLIKEGRYDEAERLGWRIKSGEKKLSKLNDVLNEVDGLINRSQQTLEEIPDKIKDAQTMEIGLAEYSKDYAERKKANAAIEKQRKQAQDNVERVQAEYDRANAEWEAALEDDALAATQEAQLAEQKKNNIRLQRDIEKARTENEKRIEAARKEVEGMEYSALKKQAREMRAWAAFVSKETPEGKNRRALAAVYTDALKSRRESGRDASALIGQGLPDGNKVVADAQALASKLGSGRDVSLKRVAKVLDRALKSTGKDDDIAAQRLYEILSKLITVTEKNAKQMGTMKKRYEALKKRTANLDV